MVYISDTILMNEQPYILKPVQMSCLTCPDAIFERVSAVY